MNIAFLTNILTGDDERGGTVHVTQIARGLLRRGHTLYTHLATESDEFIKLGAAELHRRAKEIDLFYVRIDGWHENDKLTLLRASNMEAPCIWELNAPLEESRLKQVEESRLRLWNSERRDLAGMVDCAICVSDEMGKYASDWLGIDKVRVLPNGSDPRLFDADHSQPGPLSPDRFNVIWVGSPEYPWQGLEMIRALAPMLWQRDPGIALYVSANGDDLPNLTHLGRIPYRTIPKYLASSSVGLCIYDLDVYRRTGDFYNSPLKLFDYMACGLAVLGTDIGQIRKVIQETQCGLLTDNTAGDIVDQLVQMKQSASVVKAMGERGRAAVLREYNWDRIVDRTEEIMLDLVARASKHGLTRTLKKRAAYPKYQAKSLARRVARKLVRPIAPGKP